MSNPAIDPRNANTATWGDSDALNEAWIDSDAQGWTWDQDLRAILLRYLPRWLQGPLAQDVAGAGGQQIGAIEAIHIGDTWFVATADASETPDATDQLSYWETDYAIPIVLTDSVDVRRARILAKRRGQGTRNDADFISYVRAILLPVATGDPTPVGQTGLYVVYIPHDRGWVTNFADVQAGLRLIGPSHLGMFLAPWDDINGLTYDQVNEMAWVAVNSLSFQQVEGAT